MRKRFNVEVPSYFVPCALVNEKGKRLAIFESRQQTVVLFDSVIPEKTLANILDQGLVITESMFRVGKVIPNMLGCKLVFVKTEEDKFSTGEGTTFTPPQNK